MKSQYSGPLRMSPVTGMARLAGWVLSSVHIENFSPVTGMKSGDAIIQAWNLTNKPGEKCCRIFRFYRFFKPQNSHIFTFTAKRDTKRNYSQSRAQSFSGSLSAVGRREKLWDNGISISNLIGSSYNNTWTMRMETEVRILRNLAKFLSN